MRLKLITSRFGAQRIINHQYANQINSVWRCGEKGSLSLEAAILLPLFIVGIMTLGFTIRMIGTDENVIFAASDEARLLAQQAYHIQIAPWYPILLKNRISNENIDISAMDVEGFGYLYEEDGQDGLIGFEMEYWMSSGLPIGLVDEIKVSRAILARGFIGRTQKGNPISFDAMETNADAQLVWLFPKDGERYHKRNCSFIASYPAQTILSATVREQYEPCEICHPETSENGSMVYCFLEYGFAYHEETCPKVNKYIISMEREQAEARGYTPCLKCGGAE